MRTTRTLRFRASAIVLSFATLALGLVASPAPAQAAVLTGGASLSRPFSEPVWWPLRTETKMDCYRGNPGCTDPIYHSTWLLDVVSTDFNHRTPFEPVYAMGAGIVHYGVSADQGCGTGRPTGRGNWLWIDHGDGVISWYGHLAWPFSVPNGAYVTPQSKIALMGNSGLAGCKQYPTLHYIDIAVKRGGKNQTNSGTYVQMYSSWACVNGQRQRWPSAIHPSWTRWNVVPSSPWGHWHIIPRSDPNYTCAATPPHTPTRTTSVTLVPKGSGTLRAYWVRPVTGYARTSTVVLIREYHPSIHRWLDLRKHVVSPTAFATSFGGLHLKHTFRVQVSFRNASGISAPSPWASAIAR